MLYNLLYYNLYTLHCFCTKVARKIKCILYNVVFFYSSSFDFIAPLPYNLSKSVKFSRSGPKMKTPYLPHCKLKLRAKCALTIREG